MEIEFDPAKDTANKAKHGLSLMAAVDMDLSNALVVEDSRFSYGETRYRAWGLIDGVLHTLAFTMREGRVRAISLRRSNKLEIKRYGKP